MTEGKTNHTRHLLPPSFLLHSVLRTLFCSYPSNFASRFTSFNQLSLSFHHFTWLVRRKWEEEETGNAERPFLGVYIQSLQFLSPSSSHRFGSFGYTEIVFLLQTLHEEEERNGKWKWRIGSFVSRSSFLFIPISFFFKVQVGVLYHISSLFCLIPSK